MEYNAYMDQDLDVDVALETAAPARPHAEAAVAAATNPPR
jgi:hypothetical protein